MDEALADVRAGRMHDQEMANQWALAAQMFVSLAANSLWRGVMQMSFHCEVRGRAELMQPARRQRCAGCNL